MLIFGLDKLESKEETLANYKAVRVNFEGEPRFYVCNEYYEIIQIDECGSFSVNRPSAKLRVPDAKWQDILKDCYFDIDQEDFVIEEFFKDFDITISKKI